MKTSTTRRAFIDKATHSSLAALAVFLLAASSTVRADDEETRKHILHDLGGPFIVYRSNVQAELKLSDDQKRKLLEILPGYLEETRQLPSLKGGAREKEYEKLWVFLKENLQAEQFKRLQQLELQHEGPSALLSRPQIAEQLGITEEQRHQFMDVVRGMQSQMQPLMKEAHSGGNRHEIRLKGVQLYAEAEGKIEAILNEAQRAQWAELFGKPFDVFNNDD